MSVEPTPAQIRSAFRESVRHHWVMFLIEGIALVVLGILAILAPQIASLAATVFFGWILLLSGVIGLISTLRARWGWMLASGVLDIVLGAILFAGLPGTALWALGLLIGINMIFGGWALIGMALASRPGSSAGNAAAPA